MSLVSQINRMLGPLGNMIQMLIGRAVIKYVYDDLKMQELKISVLAGETTDRVERVQEYGFTSNPPPGGEAVVLFPGGNRSLGLVIATDDRRYRITGLESGEVAIYTDENLEAGGHRIVMKRGQIIEVNCKQYIVNATQQFTVNCPSVDINET